MKDVFLSFSSRDLDKTEYLCSFLESNGVSCFIASRDIVPGHEYAAQLIENLGAARVVVLLLSNNSNSSPHVLREIEHAVSHNIPIIVYRLEDVEINKSLEYFLMTHQWLQDGNDKDELLLNSIRLILNDSNANKFERGTVKTGTHGPATIHVNSYNSNGGGKGWIVAIVAIVAVTIIAVAGMFFLKPEKTDYNNSGSDETSSDSSDKKVGEESGKHLKDDNEESLVYENYNVGDIVEFGTYRGNTIEWIVINDNGNNTITMISKYVLCMKAFDAAEGGVYTPLTSIDGLSDEQLINLRGNNAWITSNIRTWLNSSESAVTYYDQSPDRDSVSDGHNAYKDEAGFLSDFTEEEINRLVPVYNKTEANSLAKNATNGYVYSEDYVYLLSEEELSMLYDAGVSIYATPSDNCISNDNTDFYQSLFVDAGCEQSLWWLRDPSEKNINWTMIVCTELEGEMTVADVIAGYGDVGIRPVITITK